MWRLWRLRWEREGLRMFRIAWVDFRRSTVAFLYEKVAVSKRKRQATLGCFDPRLWFVSKGRVAALMIDRKSGKQTQNRETRP